MTPTASIVLCTYTEERWDDLVAAVGSLAAQTVPPAEVLVVVDHAPPLLDRVRAELPEVRALENAEEPGLSGARNSGAAAARGDVVAFLDDDAVAAPEWLERLLHAYADPEVMAVGGTVEAAWPQARPGWFPPEFGWVVGCSYRGQPEATAPVRNLIGANMSFRREALARAGRFRTELGRVGGRPSGCEETELCIRLRREVPGAVVLLEPAAVVRHRVTPERAGWRYFRRRCFAEGISKAAVARHAGAGDGLSSERAHALRALPRGTAEAAREAVRAREPRQALRALAIAAGLAITTAGYVRGTVSGHAA